MNMEKLIRSEKGLDSIECMLVVLIIGILGSLAVTLLGSMLQTAVVEVDGKEIFRGMAFCVEVKSAGAATSVDIGVPCKFPAQHYTTKDVKVTVK